MYAIKQSTAITVPFFVHDAAGDAVTGLSDGSFTKRISKNGGAFGAMTVTISELENGWYSIPLSASHSDTNGLLSITFTNGGSKQINLQWRVRAKLIDDLQDLAQSDILSDTTAFAGGNIDAAISSRSDFDETADPVELLDSGGAIGTSADELVDDIWNEALTGANHNISDSSGRRIRDLQEFGVYESGAIWIDTLNGAAGTTDYESGTAFNPVDNLPDALTLSASLGLNIFHLAPGSSIAFISTQNSKVFRGSNWTLALGGVDIAGSEISGATVTGVTSGTGTFQMFIECTIGTSSHIKNTHFIECSIDGIITVVEAGNYFFDRCHSGIAGAGTWTFEFGNAIGNTSLNVRASSGGITLESMGDTGTDIATIEGWGQIIEGTCTGGNVSIRGNFIVSNITNLTLIDDARIDTGQIADSVWDEAIASHVGVGSTGEALDNATAPTAADVADAVWDEQVAGHVAVGSFGKSDADILADTNELQTDGVPTLIAAVQTDTDNIQTRLPVSLVGGRMDADVAVMQANVITASALALDAGQEIADRVLSRNLGTGSDGGRTVQGALRILRNRRAIVAGTLTVYEEDDATPDWTAPVTTAAGNPVSEIDPA